MLADLRLSDQGHGDSSDVQASAHKCWIKGQSVVGLSTADADVREWNPESPFDCAHGRSYSNRLGVASIARGCGGSSSVDAKTDAVDLKGVSEQAINTTTTILEAERTAWA